MSAAIARLLEHVPPGEARHQQIDELMADARYWLGVDGDERPIDEVTAPIIEAFQAQLGALRERAEVYLDLVEYHSFNGLTGAEVRAARAHLALHHAVADRLGACRSGYVLPDEPNPAPALRQALYATLGTERLAHALNMERAKQLPTGD